MSVLIIGADGIFKLKPGGLKGGAEKIGGGECVCVSVRACVRASVRESEKRLFTHVCIMARGKQIRFT